MSGRNDSAKSLQERREAAGLNLAGPMPDVVIERAVADMHNLQLPSPLLRGIRSHHSSPVVGPMDHHALALRHETGATLTYGNWASSVAAPRPAAASALPESAVPSSLATTGQQQQQQDQDLELDQWLVYPEEEEGALPPTPRLRPITGPALAAIPPLSLDPDSEMVPLPAPAPIDRMAEAFDLTKAFKPHGGASWGLQDDIDSSQLPAFFFKSANEQATSGLDGVPSIKITPANPAKAPQHQAQNAPDQGNALCLPSSSATAGNSLSPSTLLNKTTGTKMNQPPEESLMVRWNGALRLIDNETLRVFVRACFCGGQRVPLSLVVKPGLVVGSFATRLMSDLRVLSRQYNLAMVYFRPPFHLETLEISANDLQHFQILVDEEEGRQIISKLMENQRFGQAAAHAGKNICSQACRTMVEIMGPIVEQELNKPNETAWAFFDNLLGSLTRHFIEMMLPQMAIYGSHPHDEKTVEVLANYANRVGAWYLSRGDFAKAKTNADMCLELIRNSAITPRPGWRPRGFRFMPDWDKDISEYKSVIYRTPHTVANNILKCVAHRKSYDWKPLKEQSEKDGHDLGEGTIEEEPETSIWGGVADPAGML